MGNLQKYSDYTVEDAEREAKEAAATRGSIRKMEQGDNVIRVLPARAGEQVFQVVHEHYVEVVGMGGSFVCPYMMAKKPCAICQEMRRLKSSGNPLDYARGDEMYARKRVYVNAVNRADKDPAPAVHVLPGKVHEDIMAMRRKFKGPSGNFTNPDEGYDLIITREGTGKKDTRYRVDLARESTPLCDDLDQADEWIANQADLSRFARLPEAGDMESALAGGAESPPAEEKPRATVTSSQPAGGRGGAQQQRGGGRSAAPASTASAGRGAAVRGRRAEDSVVDGEIDEG